MTKITFIGAGSLEFTSNLVRDILTFPLEGPDGPDGHRRRHAGLRAVDKLIQAAKTQRRYPPRSMGGG